jgi:hypothetical protein
MNRLFRAVVVCVMALLGGCAQAPAPAPAPPPSPLACAGVGGAPTLEYELFFGRSIPGRSALTDREWAEFATHVVTPRLPDGFTAFDAEGQWMNPTTHRIIAERTEVVVAAVPDTAATAAAIAAIKDAYRAQFQQRSVGASVHAICGAF